MEVFLVGRLGREDHAQARFHLVFRELFLQALQVEGILDELVVDLDQKLVAFERAEPLDPSVLLVLQCRVVRETVDFVLVLIRLTVIVLLHLHLLLLLRLHGSCLFVKSAGFHF